jgi:hypothetical protein
MKRSGLKIVSVVFVLLLAFLLLPLSGSVSAAEGYSIEISAPTPGMSVDTSELNVSVNYAMPKVEGVTIVCDVDTQMRLVALAGQAPGSGNQFQANRFFMSNTYRSSGTWSFSKDMDNWWSFGSSAPAGEYELTANLRNGQVEEIVATARVNFFYKTGISLIVPPVIDALTINRDVIVTGRAAVLTWKVTGADTVNIGPSVGGVALTGTQSVSPAMNTEYTITAINTAGTVTKTVTLEVAANEMQAVLYLYQKFDFTGKDYGLQGANGAYGNASHVFSDPTKTHVVGTFEGKQITIPTFEDGAIACGDYQGVILKWLDGLRKSPVYSDLTDGIDYGPVSSPDGIAHHWVMAWPKGTDWQTTGYNLDPWSRQATGYTPGWQFGVGNTVPDPVYDGKYPITGSALYPGETPKFSFKIPANNKQMLVKCPVNVLISNEAGKKIGWASDGSIVNEISGAGYLRSPESDGTYLWYFILPPGTYQTQITGTNDGTFRLITAGGTQTLQDYGEQPITAGAQAQLALAPDKSAPTLVLPGGKTVTPQGSSATTAPIKTKTSGKSGSSLGLIIGIIAGVIVIVLVVLLLAKRKK